MTSTATINHAAELIEQADALIVAAGAGMGVDSGLPDFRGNEGFWKAYPALAKAQMSFTEVASPRTFQSDPRLAWGFYGHRLDLYRKTAPHEGFEILKRWAQRMPYGAFVFTSNVDGQFQKAGFAADRVHECHGSIHSVQCLKPCSRDIWSAASLTPKIDLDSCQWLGELPCCQVCSGLSRPHILMFGDHEWLEGRADQQRASLDSWLSKVSRPIVIELGAGTHIPSVRYFGNEVLHFRSGRLIRINPREADVPTRLDVGIKMGALAGLLAIDAALCAGDERE
jgi:NAD-dependent SIR2 family protein deacetylase